MTRTRWSLIATVILAVLAAPLAGRAQAPRRIGYLSGNPPADTQEAFDAFRARLRELGHVEGQTLRIESRYADGNFEKLPQLAADLIRLKVDVIFTYGTPAATAARKATGTIPIVFG